MKIKLLAGALLGCGAAAACALAAERMTPGRAPVRVAAQPMAPAPQTVAAKRATAQPDASAPKAGSSESGAACEYSDAGCANDCPGRRGLRIGCRLHGHCCKHDHSETKHGKTARADAARRPWHYGYYHVMYGAPIALVVPPTAEETSDYAWGVTGTEVKTISHQFQRPYPGYGYDSGTGFLPTPPWPSSTRQFGVYPVRGPW